MKTPQDLRSARVISLCLALCLSALFQLPASGQATAWVRTGGPSGGTGYDIKARPDNPDVMYVTDKFAGVHKSTDGGRTWVNINQGIDARSGSSGDHIPAFSLAIDSNNPEVLWAGMSNHNDVYRSADGGATWEKRGTGIVETIGNLTVRGITVQPGNSNVVYIAGEIADHNSTGGVIQGKLFDLVRGVVYKSSDGGQNWGAVWRGDNLARHIIIDPTNVKTIYVSTGIFDREAANSRLEFNEAGGVGILKSTDGGVSWAAINNGLANLYVGALAMHPGDPRRLVAGTGNAAYTRGGGIYVSTDSGDSWAYAGGQHIGAVEFSTSHPSIAYAAGAREFFRSADGGQTWTSYLNRNGQSWGPVGLAPGFPIDMQIDLRDAQRLFVNNYDGGNFLTADGGASWSTASTGYTGADVKDVAVSRQDARVIYANAKTSPFKSTDGGQTWMGLNSIQDRPFQGARIAVDPEDDRHVLMSSVGGVTYESLDGGDVWRVVMDYGEELARLAPADQFQGMHALVFAPSKRLKVYGGFGNARCVESLDFNCAAPTIVGVVISEDGGRTWTRRIGTGFDTSNVPAIAVHPLDHNTAWAATMGKGIFKTTDGGQVWTAASAGLGDMSVESIAADPIRPQFLYAGTSSKGIFKSRDGGATWTTSSTGMKATERIRAVTVNPTQPDVVYAGSDASGIYASANGGISWTLINNGLRNRTVQALTISSDAKVIYAGTFGEGVFRLGSVPAATLSAPTNLAASISGSSITITWTAPAAGGTPTTYVLEAGSSFGGTDIASFSTGSTAATFSTNVGGNATFYIQVRAGNSVGTSGPSNEVVASLTLTRISLTKGWNLVGSGGTQPIPASSIFGDKTKINTVWKWLSDRSQWAFYAPSLAAADLQLYADTKSYKVIDQIEGREGFWVNALVAHDILVPVGNAYTAIDHRASLLTGWNLVTVGETLTPVRFNNYLTTYTGDTPPEIGSSTTTTVYQVNLTTLWAWDTTTSNWFYYAPSLHKNSGLESYITSKSYLDFTTNNKTLGPGVGFWVNKP